MSKPNQKPMIDRYSTLETVGIYLGIFVFLFYCLSPFIEGFLVSLKPISLLFSTPYSFWPKDGSFDAYFMIWERVPMLARYIFNSLFISFIVTVITMVIAVPAAYAFARLDFPFRGPLMGGFLAVNMFSGAVLLIPLFRLMRSIGVLNTYLAMIVPGVAFLIPTAIWLMRAYFLRIPGARGSGLGGRRQSALYPAQGHPAAGDAGHHGRHDRHIHRRLCGPVRICADLQFQERVRAAHHGSVRLLRAAGGTGTS
jgi:ABC-type Fe3+ transport system permease subunit